VRTEGYYVGISGLARCKLIIADVISGDEKATSGWDTGDTLRYAPSTGASTDTWGLSLTGADVKDPDFGVAVQVGQTGFTGSSDIYVDAVSIKIYYTAGAAAGAQGLLMTI